MLTLFFLQEGFFDVSAKFTLRFRMGRARNLEPPAPRRSPAAAPPTKKRDALLRAVLVAVVDGRHAVDRPARRSPICGPT
jgi:hypothetical protein